MHHVSINHLRNCRVDTEDQYEVVMSTGDGSSARAQDPHSAAIVTGDGSEAAAVSNSLAIALGENSSAWGEPGAWLILTEQTDSGINVVPIYIDDDEYHAYHTYALRDGEIVNVYDITQVMVALQNHFAHTYTVRTQPWDTLPVSGQKKSCTLRVDTSHVHVQHNGKTVSVARDQTETIEDIVHMIVG